MSLIIYSIKLNLAGLLICVLHFNLEKKHFKILQSLLQIQYRITTHTKVSFVFILNSTVSRSWWTVGLSYRPEKAHGQAATMQHKGSNCQGLLANVTTKQCQISINLPIHCSGSLPYTPPWEFLSIV